MLIENYSVIMNFLDLWKTTNQQENMIHEGIVQINSQSENTLKHHINAGDKANNDNDVLLNSIYSNTFSSLIFDFEFLHSYPFSQNSLIQNLSFVTRFNNNKNVIISNDKDANYKINNLRLQYDIIESQSIASDLDQFYQKSTVYFTKILSKETFDVDDTNKSFSYEIKDDIKSLKRILLLTQYNNKDFQKDPEVFLNLNIMNISVSIAGARSTIYDIDMTPDNQCEEIKRLFIGSGTLNRYESIQKELEMSNMTALKYYSKHHGFYLNFRGDSADNDIHGNGIKTSANQNIIITFTKKAGTRTDMTTYPFLFMDAQLNLKDNKLHSVVYVKVYE